ncbi:MAG: R3H domain-containing nucleic acid-binding protein [Candidatus Melainabacteria bacterium]
MTNHPTASQSPAEKRPKKGVPAQEVQLDDLALLIRVLPKRVQEALAAHDRDQLIEVVLDLGRPPEARFADKQTVFLSEDQVTREEIAAVVGSLTYFSADNRAGIPRTLHRVSAIKNRQGDVIGLTCRVGKTVTGTIVPIRDVIESGRSILILGRPGIGKTTKLREIAKLLSDDLGKRTVIVDTSNEIAGDGDIPHPAVGRARRMQVASPDQQGAVMIEAVQNHTPEVIIVDEIGTEEEALAARTIAERGVILIATAHGSNLENLIKNPVLSDLIGGIQTVTLGDDEAKRRATQKTVLERAKKPTFDICIELQDRHTMAIYPDVAEAVDQLLRGWTLFPEIRRVDRETGETRVLKTEYTVLPEPPDTGTPESAFTDHARDRAALSSEEKQFRIFLYGIGKSLVDRILERLNLHHIVVTKNIHDAHAVLVLKGSSRPGSKILKVAQDYEIPVFYAKTNTMPQIQRALREAVDAEAGSFAGKIAEDAFETETELALKETQEAIALVHAGQEPVELSPRRSYIRRLQHELVEKHFLTSVSVGDEPNRRLKLLPPRKSQQATDFDTDDSPV